MIWSGGAHVGAGSFCQAAARSDGQVGGNEDAFERCQVHHADSAKTWGARPCGSASVRSLGQNAWKHAMKYSVDVKAFAQVVVHQ